MLQPLGLQLKSVADGAAALAAFQDEAFDLVLLDMQMPVMDGVTAGEEIRRWEGRHARSATPIVMLSANVSEDDRSAASRAGVDAYLTKPLNRAELLACVDRLLAAAARGEVARAA